MLDEEIDHIIREAADNHHPAYNDKAWEKMEMKLDKHLPQKTDRRRLIFFLLFFLLLGIGILFTVNKLNTGKNITAEKNSSNSTPDKTAPAYLSQKNTEDKDKKPETENAVDNTIDKAALNNSVVVPDKNRLPGENKNYSEKFYGNNRFASTGKGRTKVKITNPDLFNYPAVETDLNGQKNIITGKNGGKQRVTITGAMPEEGNDNKSRVTELVNTDNREPNAADKTAIVKANAATAKDSANTDKNKKELAKKTDDKSTPSSEKKKKKNNVADNFGLTFSIGPDMSFVKLNNTGKTTLTYGAGLSYSFAKRFTARAGFYVSKKVYEASPDQYHTPGVNYPYLTGVNANCKVYEIPVSLAYNFGQHKNHTWFGNVGLSSFIMKKEDYTYNYKTPAGQTYAYYQELNNKNKHYFAVLTLSAGYKYQLTRRLSMQAEPYAKIPLAGVGQGKIKLNSTGILFTLTYKPFKKKK